MDINPVYIKRHFSVIVKLTGKKETAQIIIFFIEIAEISPSVSEKQQI